MFERLKHSRLFIFSFFTYLVFWCMLLLTFVLISCRPPRYIQEIAQNLCAWSPTIVVLILFKKLFPQTSLRDFLRDSFFKKINPLDFVFSFLLQVLFLCAMIGIYLVISKKTLGSLEFIGINELFMTFIINLTSGPLGEELGWRGYAINELQKRYSPLYSSVLLGLIWGFWHFPLWLISGLYGLRLLVYILSFLLAIVSTSILITLFYNKSKNVVIAMWIHFWFNFLLKLVNIDIVYMLGIISAVYFIVIITISFYKKEMVKCPEKVF